MTDIVERLRSRARFDTCISSETIMADAADVIESLRQQLAESQVREKVRIEALTWASSVVFSDTNDDPIAQALALPSDSTALEQVKLAAKREALLGAILEFERMAHGVAGAGVFPEKLQEMLKVLT